MSEVVEDNRGWVVRIAPEVADHYIYDGDEGRARRVYEAAKALGEAMEYPRPIAWIGFVELGDDGVPVKELPDAAEWIE